MYNKLKDNLLNLFVFFLLVQSLVCTIIVFDTSKKQREIEKLNSDKEFYQPATELYDKMIEACGEGYYPLINTIDNPDGSFLLNIECVESRVI